MTDTPSPQAHPDPPPAGGASPPPGPHPPPGSQPPPGPQQPPGPSPYGGDVVDTLRRLRRSRSDRVVAGVCGGVARHLGVDPLLLRIVIAVLVLFGGVGLLLYALGWLLIPAEDSPTSVAQEAIGRGGQRAGVGTIVLAAVLAIIVLGALFDGGHGWSWGLLLALAVAGFLLLVERSRGVTPPAALPTAPAEGPVPPTANDAATTRPLGTYETDSPPAPPVWVPAPMPPRPRERSALLGLTLSVVLVALGVLAAVDVAGASIPGGAYWATALAVVGLGLVVGTWLGRSRGLVAIGVVLALGTGASLAADQVPDGVRISQRPASLTDAGISADYGSGSVRYDLRDVDFADVNTRLALHVGAGEITVIVPPEVDVTVDASAGMGDIDVFDRSADGFGTDVQTTDNGDDGPGGGSLSLDLSVGLGRVEVRRG